MNVLIVGGTGVISTGITQQLVAHGDHVTVANRDQTGADLPPGVAQLVANLDFRTIDWLIDRDRIASLDTEPFDDRLNAAYRRLGANLAAEMAG